MATVIDSLLIELSLNSKKFSTAAKQSVNELRKLEAQAKKSFEASQKSAEELGEGFNFAKSSLIALGSVISFGAMKSFLVDTTRANVALGNTSNLLGLSAAELKSWGQVAKLAGGDLNSVTNSFKNLQRNLADVKGGGGEEFLKYLSYIQQATGKDLGFNFATGEYDIYKIADALAELKKQVSSGQYIEFAQGIGIDQDSLVLLEKGGYYLKENKKYFDELNSSMDDNTKKAEQLNEQLEKVQSAWESMKQTVYGKVANWLLTTDPETQAAWERYDAIRAKKEGAAKPSIGQTDARKKLLDYFVSAGWTKEQAAGIVGNLEQESSLNPNATNKSYLGTHRGIAQLSPDRQADFKKWAGFDITDPRADLLKQAEFTNYELQKGKYIAAGNLLKQQSTVGGATKAVMDKYEIPGDNSYNRRLNYASAAVGANYSGNQNLSSMLGSNLSAPSTTVNNNNEVNTNIASIVVNTKATDANAIVTDLGRELQKNTLINTGIFGNR